MEAIHRLFMFIQVGTSPPIKKKDAT